MQRHFFNTTLFVAVSRIYIIGVSLRLCACVCVCVCESRVKQLSEVSYINDENLRTEHHEVQKARDDIAREVQVQ